MADVCTIDDCTKPARHNGMPTPICPMHYHRKYRHGDVNKTAFGVRQFVRRYRSVYLPRHPLASRSGKVYAHRLALFESIGPGEHACHWCGNPVHWHPAPDQAPLHCDHLNSIGDDNRPENLVPSCKPCNTARGSKKRHLELVAEGWWSEHDTIARLAKGRAQSVGHRITTLHTGHETTESAETGLIDRDLARLF